MNIELAENEKLLVVAPHPDDESIGCGGLLNKFRGQCDMLLVTNGHLNKPESEEIIKIRQKEFELATKASNIENVFQLNIYAQEIQDNFKKFLTIDYTKYKYVFVPNRYEIVQDHVDTYYAVKKALNKSKSKADLIEYEVWTAIRFPNVKVDITPVVEEKKKAILLHESQIKDLDYVGMIIGLNAYRGKGHGCDYAEVFYSEKRAKIKRNKERKKRIKGIIKR